MNKDIELQDGILTAAEIMGLLGISKAHAYRLIKSNKFTVLNIGNSIRVPRKSFYEWVNTTANMPITY